MIAYLLAYLFLFSTISTSWHFVGLSVLSFVVSPDEEKKRIFVAFLLAFFLFALLMAPSLRTYQSGNFEGGFQHSISFVDSARDYMKEKLFYLNDNAGVMYSSLIMGDMDYSSNLGNLVREHGIFHLFVVSGFHFSILFMAIGFILTKIFKFPYKISLLIILLSSSFYYLILSGGFGATRAYFTILLGILAFFLGRSADSENVLFTISTFWIIVHPTSIYQLGFQLTFIATYLVVLVNKLEPIKNIESGILKDMLLSLIVSIGVSGFLFFKGKTMVLFSFLLIAISTPIISLLMIAMFVFALLPPSLFFMENYFAKGIDFICDTYYHFLLSFSNIGEIKMFLPINVSIAMQVILLFFLFSRKLISYGWNRNNLFILLIALLFCYLI